MNPNKMPDMSDLMLLCQTYDMLPKYEKQFNKLKKKYSWDELAFLSVEYANKIYNTVIHVDFKNKKRLN